MNDTSRLDRRQLLGATAGLAAGTVAWSTANAAEPDAAKGRLNQSIVQWCFEKHWDLERMCQIARQLGCKSIELVDFKDWPTLKKHGLTCALARSHWFDKGMNNPKYQEMCIDKIRSSIDASADFGAPSIITFTGFREDIPDDAGIKNCVEGYKKIVGYAEKKKVNLSLEMLNSKVSEEMKGHPGYQGDHILYCLDIVKKVGSPRLGLLFDVYHVQIMDGDIIRNLKECLQYVNHVHTAGNPGRCELDANQEINYKAVMKVLADAKFQGYVGQEFIPIRDPLAGLKEAVAVCTV